MRVAKAFAAALVLLASAAGMASAQDDVSSEGVGTFYSHIYYDMGTGLQYTPKGGFVTQLAGDVYNNTNPQGAIIGSITSTDLNAQWGDRLTTTGTGILQENDFTIVNSGSSAGPLLTATFGIALFDGTTSALIGSYSTNPVNFGSLGQGFFSIITITGLGGLNINVNTTDVIMRQQVLAKTGTASRLGVILFDPPTIGSSTNTMYINATTVGPAGFYNLGAAPNFVNANPGYRINLNQPVPAAAKSWGAIKAYYKK
jgi:hypothetical protein